MVIFAILSFFTQPLSAQNFGSPYSYYGIGLLQPADLGINQGMAGTGIGLRSFYSLNLSNPAAYNSLRTPSTQITELGIDLSFTQMSDNDHQNQFSDGYLSHLASWFKLNQNISLMIGLLPYSKVSYQISNTSSQPVDLPTLEQTQSGSGGINKVFAGMAWSPFTGLSIGADFNYLFGPIHRENSISGEGLTTITFRNTTTQHGFHIKYGIQYSLDLGKRRALTLGAIYEPAVTLNTSAEEEVIFGVDSANYSDPIAVDKVTIPVKYGFGMSYFNGRNLNLAFDYTQHNWSTIPSDLNFNYTDSKRYSLALDYIPGYADLNYLRRMGYRIGLFYESSKLQINSSTISSYGFSAGLSFPLKDFLSRINLSYEYKVRGFSQGNPIKEVQHQVKLNFSFHDLWFQRKKVD